MVRTEKTVKEKRRKSLNQSRGDITKTTKEKETEIYR